MAVNSVLSHQNASFVCSSCQQSHSPTEQRWLDFGYRLANLEGGSLACILGGSAEKARVVCAGFVATATVTGSRGWVVCSS